MSSLIHYSKCSGPDIAFVVNNEAWFWESPTLSVGNKIINIFKYLNYLIDLKIIYDYIGVFIAHSDADFESDKQDHKSISGNLICYSSKPIYWTSKKKKKKKKNRKKKIFK